MNLKLIIFLPLLGIVTFLSAQNTHKGDTLKIESETLEVKVPSNKIQLKEAPTHLEEVLQIETSLKKELDEYILEMQAQKFISNNVITDVDLKVIETDGKPALKATYSYSLLNNTLIFQSDDFGLGKYRIDASNALQVTLQLMKKDMQGQLAKYISPTKEISVTINGSADATPIRNTIPYNGEYGNTIIENCKVEGIMQKMEVSVNHGINSNPLLAFVRSVAVKDYIKSNIFTPDYTKIDWGYSATVSERKGGQHRRVSIEIIVYNAFEK
jgi:hypothetical protein